MQVTYESGEKLYFYEDGEPDAKWTRALKKYFDLIFEKAGYTDVLPEARDITIEKLTMSFNVDTLSYEYGVMMWDDGKDYFYREIYDLENDAELSMTMADISDTMYEEFQDMMEVCDLNGLELSEGHGSIQTNEYVEIYVDYQSGRQIYREYYDEDISEEWYEKRDYMMGVMDAYIEAEKL